MKLTHAVGALLLLAGPAFAQTEDPASFPSRTVRVIVPSSPGGPIDAVARIMADAFKTVWPVPVVVENKPGAGTSTGAAFVAQSPPDGYTLLVNPDSIAVNPSLYPHLSADPLKSFEPVSMLVSATQVLVVRPDLGASDLKSFIALAKSKQEGLNIASAGAGTISHLTGVLLEQRAGFRTTHVPFRGAAPALTAMLGGHVDGMWVMLAPAVPHLRSGAVKALAVTSATRDANLPDVPTAEEFGRRGFPGRQTGRRCSCRPARPSRSSRRSIRRWSNCSKSPRCAPAWRRSASSRAATAARSSPSRSASTCRNGRTWSAAPGSSRRSSACDSRATS